jgi:hypothetical protein
MRISEAFPSNYLKASDLGGREWKLTMSRVEMENLGSEMKPVLYFHGAEMGLVLNKTNSEMIVLMYGDETNAWSGQELVVKPDKTSFQGKIVDCIRVVWHGGRPNGPLPAAAAQTASVTGAPLAPAAAPLQPSGSPLGSDPLDGDAIPF